MSHPKPYTPTGRLAVFVHAARSPKVGVMSVRALALAKVIRDRPGESVHFLADAIGCARSATTRNLDRLVKDGFAIRRIADKDKRLVAITLTEEGEQAVRALEKP